MKTSSAVPCAIAVLRMSDQQQASKPVGRDGAANDAKQENLIQRYVGHGRHSVATVTPTSVIEPAPCFLSSDATLRNSRRPKGGETERGF